jgi:two-component system NtrC family sensor kinase
MKTRVPPRYTISTKLFILLTLMLVVVFSLIAWLNTNLYLNLLEKNVYEHAFQLSDVIKSSTWYSMLQNHREDLAKMIANIGKEKGLEGIWIYDKRGAVKFASDTTALNTVLAKNAEQCSFCHASEAAIGVIPKRDRIRHLKSASGQRIVGLINPIENNPACYNADCHAHKASEKLLGLIDIKLSLSDVDRSMVRTRNTVLLLSGALVFITALLFRGFIQRLINRPISKLIQGTEQVADMNLDYRTPVISNDDLGYLTDSFNKMTLKLKDAYESEKQMAETLQAKNEELERSRDHIVLVEKMASLGKLAAVVAHEINNPMAGILTYSKLSIRQLSESHTDDNIEKSINNMKMISSEAKRCGDMVKNLLLFSRKRYEDMSRGDIRPIIDRSVELAKASNKVADISFELQVDTDNTELVCDQNDIQQMLMILLINAVEAVPKEGGKIKIRLSSVHNKRILRLEVGDNGVGISREDLPHIFEPFYSTKKSEENTGLGLAVAFRIVETRHGGEISVKSKPNEGTTFTIDLPIDGPAYTKVADPKPSQEVA